MPQRAPAHRRWWASVVVILVACSALAIVAIVLSYRAPTVDADLAAADRYLTGGFLEEFRNLATSTVIPGARLKNISVRATVPSIGVSTADETSAEVLIFVNQSTTLGSEPPTETASSVRVHMVKVDSRWLVDRFEPI